MWNILGVEAVLEEEMYPVVEEFLSDYEVYREVPFYSKRVDVVGWGGDIVSVELKVKNWRDAFHQAWVNQLFSNRAFMAVWHKNSKNVDLELLKRYNIGLLEINGWVKVLHEPHSRPVIASMKNVIKVAISKGEARRFDRNQV